jgi:hypothetical protein
VVVVGSLPSLGCCVVLLADEEVFSHDHVRIFAQKEDCFSERLGYDSAERVVARRSLGLHCLVFALFVFLAFAYDWLIYHWLVLRSHRTFLHIHTLAFDLCLVVYVKREDI